MNAQKARMKADEWSVPHVLCPIQVFLKQVIFYLCSLKQDYSLYMLAKHLPFTQWAPQWRTFFSSVYIKGVLVLDCGGDGAAIMPSTILHKSGVSGWLQ